MGDASLRLGRTRAIGRNRTARAAVLGVAAVLAGAALAGQARASEGGASIYLLGSGGPEAAVMPPVRGLFLANTTYVYDGSAGGNIQFPLGGNVVAGLDATLAADFPTLLWVPSTSFAGGTLGLGAAVPVGDAFVDVSAVISGPLGNRVTVSRSDDALSVGDPLLMGMLGWKLGEKVSVQASAFVNIPIGRYREGKLSNISFHRWAVDTSLAATWHDAPSGWDVSGKAGFTFNGENDFTDYDTGTEFHLEGSIEKRISKKVTLGVQAYWFDQVSGDSGPGATLGPFEGRVWAVGGQGSYSFKVGKAPVTLRLHAMKEFDAVNRLEGESVWLDLSMPLAVWLPAAPPHE